MPPDSAAIADASTAAVEHGWSLVFDHHCGLDEQQTDAVLAGADPSSLGAPVSRGDVPGILAVRRDAWDAGGGMDVRFGAGYGYEDCALRNWLAHTYGTHYSPGHHTLCCLWHPHTEVPAQTNSDVFWGEYAGLAPHLN
jgi:hypothetical protein